MSVLNTGTGGGEGTAWLLDSPVLCRPLTAGEVGLSLYPGHGPACEEEISSHCSHSHSACSYSHHCCCARRSFTASLNLAQEVKLIVREIRYLPSPISLPPPTIIKLVGNKLSCRFMTKRLREKDEEDMTISDWKFAAMVIDRFCLIGLTIYTVLTTMIMFISAPHLIVK